MDLENASYVESRRKRVTVWPKPDKDGDGPEVWRDNVAGTGEVMGSERVTDANGNIVRSYPAPSGFANFPSFDHTDHWLRTDNRGRPYRNKDGHTVEIQSGSVLIENADGTTELLTDEYKIWLFSQSHEKDGAQDAELPGEKLENRVIEETENAEIAKLQKQLADLLAQMNDGKDVEPEDQEEATPKKATPAKKTTPAVEEKK
jgi:hypothetical protein